MPGFVPAAALAGGISAKGVFTGIGVALSALSQFQQGRAESAQARFQANLLQQQAVRRRQEAAAQESAFRRRQARFSGRQRALFGGAGVTFEGTPLLVQEDTAAEIELAALNIRAGGAVEATRLEQQATFQRRFGSSASRAGTLRAGSTLLTGFGLGFGGNPTSLTSSEVTSLRSQGII